MTTRPRLSLSVTISLLCVVLSRRRSTDLSHVARIRAQTHSSHTLIPQELEFVSLVMFGDSCERLVCGTSCKHLKRPQLIEMIVTSAVMFSAYCSCKHCCYLLRKLHVVFAFVGLYVTCFLSPLLALPRAAFVGVQSTCFLSLLMAQPRSIFPALRLEHSLAPCHAAPSTYSNRCVLIR